MFICEKCGEQSKPGEESKRVVVETRPRMYDNGDGVARHGHEIVKEITVCISCRDKLTAAPTGRQL